MAQTKQDEPGCFGILVIWLLVIGTTFVVGYLGAHTLRRIDAIEKKIGIEPTPPSAADFWRFIKKD